MREERIIREASFTPEAIRYHALSATIGSIVVFVVLAFMLAVPTVGLSLLLLLAPVGVWALAKWYYTLYFRKLSCVLTARKLLIGKGLLFRTEKAIPLDKITDMQMKQGPLMRYLDLESMSVETAGNAGSASGALVSLVGIKDSRDFRQAVLDRRDRVVGSADFDDEEGASPAPTGSPRPDDILTEIRDILVRIDSKLDADRHG